MNVTDLCIRVLTELLFKAMLWALERFSRGEYAANVTHSLLARWQRSRWRALGFAAMSLGRALCRLWPDAEALMFGAIYLWTISFFMGVSDLLQHLPILQHSARIELLTQLLIASVYGTLAPVLGALVVLVVRRFEMRWSWLSQAVGAIASLAMIARLAVLVESISSQPKSTPNLWFAVVILILVLGFIVVPLSRRFRTLYVSFVLQIRLFDDLIYSKGRCVVCGLTARLEMSHVVPMVRLTDTVEADFQLLCPSCRRQSSISTS